MSIEDMYRDRLYDALTDLRSCGWPLQKVLDEAKECWVQIAEDEAEAARREARTAK